MDPVRALALELSKGQHAGPKSIERVAARTSEEAARWAFAQWELRERARTKFERAAQMLFDRDGLEMASHEVLARYHASRFPMVARVADLTTGIGADLIALAARNQALGFEIRPDRAEMARHNLAANGVCAEVRLEDCLRADWDFPYAFADPARRTRGRRTLDPACFEPPLAELVWRMRSLEMGCIKLSPMLADSVLKSLGCRLEFVSLGWECREALVFVGAAFPQPKEPDEVSVWAVRAETGEALRGGSRPSGRTDIPASYLLEADPAAIRAGALGALCEKTGSVQLGDSNGYLTTERLTPGTLADPWLRSYTVLAHGNADEKRIRADLVVLDARVSAVKVRGLKLDPRQWERRVHGTGAKPIALILYPVGRSLRYVLAEALASPQGW